MKIAKIRDLWTAPGMKRNLFSNSYGEASAFRPKEWLFIVWKNEQEEGEIKGNPRLKEAKGLKGGEKEGSRNRWGRSREG